jgi:SAM-dependent methyltransferase
MDLCMDGNGGPLLDPAILAYYNRRPEETRLERGLSQLEAARTRALIQRFAPPAPAVVLDVGGAAGAYATWLAEAGHEVHLLDPVPRLVAEARRRSAAASRPLATCEVGDARTLARPAASADVVLLLGPLYHLTEAADRARALAEAARVLRPGGVLFAAAISRWASLLDGLAYDFLAAADYRDAAERALRDGQHRNGAQRDGLFTTAYFHRPEELRAAVAAAGLAVVGLFGLEGPARMLADFEARWADPRRRADLLWAAELVESEPSLLGLSSHILAVARKAGNPLTPAG